MTVSIYKSVENLISEYGTNNPEYLCEILGIKIKVVNYGTASFVGEPINTIFINQKYDKLKRMVVLAHEIGHRILHSQDGINHFRNSCPTLENIEKEHQANLFAAYLLFDDSNLQLKFNNMNSYLLNNFLDDICDASK